MAHTVDKVEGNIVEAVTDRRHYTLGVLEHGMYSKRMCKHGRPLRIFKEEVSANKSKKRGSRDVLGGVRWFIVPMKRVTTVEGRNLGNYNLDEETYNGSDREQI